MIRRKAGGKIDVSRYDCVRRRRRHRRRQSWCELVRRANGTGRRLAVLPLPANDRLAVLAPQAKSGATRSRRGAEGSGEPFHVVPIGKLGHDDPVADARSVVKELKRYDEALYAKPRWLVLNKLDLIPADEREARIAASRDRWPCRGRRSRRQ